MGGGVTTRAGLGGLRGLITASFSYSFGLSFHYTQPIFSQPLRRAPRPPETAGLSGRLARGTVVNAGACLLEGPPLQTTKATPSGVAHSGRGSCRTVDLPRHPVPRP